jgi:hypothetical protein
MAPDKRARVFLRGLYESSPRFTLFKRYNFSYMGMMALQRIRGTSIQPLKKPTASHLPTEKEVDSQKSQYTVSAPNPPKLFL